MRIKSSQLDYISRKIILDLLASKIVRLVDTQEQCIKIISKVLADEIAKEAALDAKVEELLAAQEEQIDLMQADVRNLFWRSKSHLAEEYGVIMNYEERYTAVSLKILSALINEDAINFTVGELRVRNVIYKAIMSYLKLYDELDSVVYEKIKHIKRKIIPGSEEYELIYNKLYQEELNKHGL